MFNANHTPWVQFTDAPYTLRHIAWHFVFGVSLLCDGLVGVLSLGLVQANVGIKFIETSWQSRLFPHHSFEEPDKIVLDDPNMTDDEVKSRIAKALGIDPNDIIQLSDTPQSVRGTIPKNQDWN